VSLSVDRMARSVKCFGEHLQPFQDFQLGEQHSALEQARLVLISVFRNKQIHHDNYRLSQESFSWAASVSSK
jgi:hypothetical protein